MPYNYNNFRLIILEMKDLGFNRQVLVGNWFEDLEHSQVTHANTYTTTYSHDYVKPSRSDVCKGKASVDREVWTNRINGEVCVFFFVFHNKLKLLTPCLLYTSRCV